MNMIQNAKDQVLDLTVSAYQKAAAEGLLPQDAAVTPSVEIPKDTANAMYPGRLAKDQKAGKDLQPTIDKMNALIDDYDVKSKPLFCAQAGLVDEIVDMPMMRNYIVAFTDSCYQNPESICPFHQMLLPRTIKDYDSLKK